MAEQPIWSQENTDKAMRDPQPGDRFSEMCAFWVLIVHRDGDMVVTIETPATPCTLPGDGIWHRYTLKELRKRFRYSSTNKHYWVRLHERGIDKPERQAQMAEWYDECPLNAKPQYQPTAEELAS